MIAGLNLLSLLFLLGTMAVLLVRYFRGTTRGFRGRMILLPFLFLVLATLTNLAEHGGISDIPDNWENILGILFFPFLIFTIHSALLKRELRRSEESDKLKSAFLENLSHEIRTPLNGIMGFCELLREGSADPGETREYAELLGISSDRFLRLMDNLILLSRMESEGIDSNPESFDPEPLIGKLVDEIRLPAKKKGVTLKVEKMAGESPGPILTDRLALTIILGNLIENALKFTETGSITVSFGRKGKIIVIDVSDTGCGMSELEKTQAFQHFGRSDSGKSTGVDGMGLGLPISHKLALALGGKITLESRPGDGTKFTLELRDQG